jgi:hypothetical protein
MDPMRVEGGGRVTSKKEGNNDGKVEGEAFTGSREYTYLRLFFFHSRSGVFAGLFDQDV